MAPERPKPPAADPEFAQVSENSLCQLSGYLHPRALTAN